MRAVTQIYLLPCKVGTKVVFFTTDPTSESSFRLGSFQFLLEAKAASKCLPRASQWFSSFEGSHCAVACVSREKVKETSDPQLNFLPWVQRVWSTGSPIPAALVSEEVRCISSEFMWVPVASPTSLIKASPPCVVSTYFPARLQRLHISG